MARHNLFLGKARGKIGDVVLSQLDGKQVARARNRNPKNPKTNKQMYQRAIMASVMQMYSAGKMIFDHSFEGKTVKFGAMRRFMSVNAKKLRADILADLANNTSNARVVHPGAVAPCPWTFRVSEGQYGTGGLTVDQSCIGDSVLSLKLSGSSGTTANVAFQPKDIYTILVLFIDGSTNGSSSLVSPATQFGFIRLICKNELPTGNLEDCSLSDVFDVEVFNLKYSTGIFEDNMMSDTMSIVGVVPSGCSPVGIACVRSAEDSGLRSTADFFVIAGEPWGITSQHILDVWNADVKSLGDSDLILEGGSLDGGTTTSGGGGGGGGVTITGRTSQSAALKSGVSGTISGNPAAVAQMSDNTTRPVVNNATDKILMRYNGTMYITMELTTAGDPPVTMDLALSHTTWENSQFVTVAQMEAAGF